MKGSMLLSLIALLVISLFVESRIDDFLHGGEPEPAPADGDGGLPDFSVLSDWASAIADAAGALADWVTGTGSADAGARQEADHVVITEDTLRTVWVWIHDGQLYSTSEAPQDQVAQKVMIPKDMTAAEFFGDPSSSSDPSETQPDGTGGDESSSRAGDGSRAAAMEALRSGLGTLEKKAARGLQQLSPEQRRKLLEQGMQALRGGSMAVSNGAR
jgi:hypothetical protein